MGLYNCVLHLLFCVTQTLTQKLKVRERGG